MTNIYTAIEKIQEICGDSKGRSQLFRSGSHGHLSGIRHYYESSAQDAIVSVEPGSADDLAKIMAVIKDSSNVKFAIKGGGHATNPEFSSTSGIQISMSRFTDISPVEDEDALAVGAGCVFDEIYKFIRPQRRNIVGGGGSVGIGGWLMGGGYSLKTNQYGLGIDNLVEVEMVLPEGRVVKATATENDDLFWAIKGGGNNFGIATKFVLKAHQQGTNGNGLVYGGLLTFDKTRVERVKTAILKFAEQTDPKAAVVAAFRFYRNQGVQEFKFTVLAFYDDKEPASNPFQEFLDIRHHGHLANSPYTTLNDSQTLLYSHISADLATEVLSPFNWSGNNDPFAPASFPSLGISGISVMNGRARWGNVMVSKYTRNLINGIEAEAKAAKELMEEYNGRMVVADIWPFLSTMFDNSAPSAWPHESGKPNGPILVYFMWEGKANDEVWIDQMKMALEHIHQIAKDEGCTTDDTPVYCNTALGDVQPKQIYQGNLDRLSGLRLRYDAHNVMGRTGGFRIPLA